jgi:hypothetical protein
MTRFAAILLALSFATGDARAASPEAAYLAARNKAITGPRSLTRLTGPLRAATAARRRERDRKWRAPA